MSENDDFELYSYILFNNINTVFKYLYKFYSYPLWKTSYNVMSDYVLAVKFLDATSPPITRHSHYLFQFVSFCRFSLDLSSLPI